MGAGPRESTLKGCKGESLGFEIWRKSTCLRPAVILSVNAGNCQAFNSMAWLIGRSVTAPCRAFSNALVAMTNMALKLLVEESSRYLFGWLQRENLYLHIILNLNGDLFVI